MPGFAFTSGDFLNGFILFYRVLYCFIGFYRVFGGAFLVIS